ALRQAGHRQTGKRASGFRLTSPRGRVTVAATSVVPGSGLREAEFLYRFGRKKRQEFRRGHTVGEGVIPQERSASTGRPWSKPARTRIGRRPRKLSRRFARRSPEFRISPRGRWKAAHRVREVNKSMTSYGV